MTPQLSPSDEETLLTTPLFAEIDRAAVLELVNGATVIRCRSRKLLFSKGDPADRFFLVLAGRVDLFALTEGGDQTIIDTVEQGHTFAEAAIFASMRFPVHAEAAPHTRLLSIPAQPFLRRLAEKRGLTAALLASLARWQQRVLREIAGIKSQTPAQRLGLFLLGLAQSDGGARDIHLPLTKVQLASRIGVTPESLSRVLARLRPLGVVSRGRAFVVEDPDALRRYCGGE